MALLTDEEVFGPAGGELLSDEDVFGPPPEQVGVGGAIARGIPAGLQWIGNETVNSLTGLGSIVANEIDRGVAAVTGDEFNNEAWNDYQRNFVDRSAREAKFYEPGAGQEFTPGGQTAFDVTKVISGLLGSLAAGSKAVPGAATLPQRMAQGVTLSMPVSAEIGQQDTQYALDKGATVPEAAVTGATSVLSQSALNALPVSAAGGLAKRAITGGAIGVGGGVAQNELVNATLPEGAERGFTDEDAMLQGGLGAVMAAALGARAPLPKQPAPPVDGGPVVERVLTPERPALPAPETRPALPAPETGVGLPEPQPSGVIAVDPEGVARPMSLGDVYSVQQAQQARNDVGLTPDIVRVQERNATQREYAPDPLPALPEPRPSDVIAVDSEGVARPMSLGDVYAADQARQGREDLGLTPDIVRAQARSAPRQDTPIEPRQQPAAVEPPAKVDAPRPAEPAAPVVERGAYRSYERTVLEREAKALLEDARAKGIPMTPDQAAALAERRKPTPDRVTDMWRSEARNDIADEAAEYSRRTGRPATRVSFDIQNVGGLNGAGGQVEVDAKVLKRIAAISREEANAAGADGFEITRHGGDEYAIDLFGVDQAAGDAIGARIAARIDEDINWRLGTKKDGVPVALLDNPKDRLGDGGTGVYFKAMQYDPAKPGVATADEVDNLIDLEKKIRRGTEDVDPESLGFVTIPDEAVVPTEQRPGVLAERAARKSAERGAEPRAAEAPGAGGDGRPVGESRPGQAGEPVAEAADTGPVGAGEPARVGPEGPRRSPRAGPGGSQGGAFDPTVFGLDKLGEAIRNAYKTVLGDQFSPEQRAEWRQFGEDLRAAAGGTKAAERLSRRSLAVDMWRHVLASTDGSLRALVKNYSSPTLKTLADKFHATAGEGSGIAQTFDEATSGEAFTRLNKASEISAFLRDNKLTSPESQARIVRMVENPKLPRPGAEGKAAAQVEAYFREMHGYLKEAGVEVDEVTGYFPRQFDTGEVVSRPAEFLAKAKAAYMAGGADDVTAQAQANALFTAVLYGDSGVPGVDRGGGTAAPSFVKARVFTREAAKILDDAKFYARDIEQNLVGYTTRAVKRAEIARRFGDNWSGWGDLEKQILKEDPAAVQILDQVRELVAVSAGVQQSSAGARLQKFSSGLRTWTTLGLLDQAALASMGELMLAPLRATKGDIADFGQIAGNLTAHLKNSARTLVGAGRDKQLQGAYDFAQDLGVIAGEGQASLMAARFMGGDPVGRIQGKALAKFFQRNLLEQLTNYTRVQTLTQGSVFVRRLAADLAAGGKKNAFFLRELGVPAGKEKAFADWVVKQTATDIRPADMSGEFGKIYATAMRRFVDQTVMRPSNSTRPAWATTPLGGVVFQLQSFGYAFQKNVLNRQARLGREVIRNADFTKLDAVMMSAWASTTLTALVGLQYMIAEGRDEVFGAKDRRELTPWAKVERAVSRAGGFGVADPMIQTIGGARYDRSVSASLMGPGVSSAVNAADVGAKALVNNSPNTNTQERAAARALYDFGVEPLVNLALTPAKVSLATTAITLAGTRMGREAFVDAIAGEKTTKSENKPIHGVFETPPPAGKKKDAGTGWR